MKKIIIGILTVLTLFSSCRKESTNPNALKDNEVLKYVYDQPTQTLNIYKTDNDSEELYFQSKNTRWGEYQIADTKRAMIIGQKVYEKTMPLFYLNGNTGSMTYVMDVPRNVRMDESGKYIIFESVDAGAFKIIDLENKLLVAEIVWEMKNKNKWIHDGASFSFFKSVENSEYDYIVDFGIEYLSIASAYINIKNKEIKTIYDDSDLAEIYLRESKDYGEAYTGVY